MCVWPNIIQSDMSKLKALTILSCVIFIKSYDEIIAFVFVLILGSPTWHIVFPTLFLQEFLLNYSQARFCIYIFDIC